MPANLKNSAVATGLEKVSFNSNPKERQCQRMLKLPHNCTHLNASKVMLKILTEAEDIKKRWQEYTEELYQKDLHDPDNHHGVITHLEPDILECELM